MNAQGYLSALLLSRQPTEKLVLVESPPWVKSPLIRRVLATSEPEGIPEGIKRNPDIVARMSEPGVIPDVARRRL
jgi:hypothetical protein